MITRFVSSAWGWIKDHPATILLMIVALAVAHFSPQQGHGPVLLMGSLGSTAVLDGLLKDFYDDEWVKSGVNDRHPLKDVIEEKLMDKKYGGRRVIYGHHVSRNKSPFATGEYGLFAEADVQGHIDIQVDARKMMGRTILTPEAIADTADSDMAWEDAEENNFDRLVIDLARRDEMMLSYDGRGVLARIDDASPSGAALVGVDSPGGVTGTVFGNRFLRVGEYVAAINPATGGIRTGISKVASLAATGVSATFEAAPDASWADNDYLVKAANATVTDPLDTEYEHWFWGLLGIFDDGTYRANYGGGDRTLWSSLNTYVNAATGALSTDTMQMLADVMDQRSGGITSLMLAHHSTRRLVIKLTQADRRYAGTDLQKPDSGTVAFKQGDITLGEVPIKAIRDFPYGTLLGIDVEMSKLRRYTSTKGEWVKDGDGRILVRSGTGATARDAFEAWYRMRYQYWAKFPAAAWRADGITGATVTIARPLGD
jgi:hypothetical protein